MTNRESLVAALSSLREPYGFAWEDDSREGMTYAELVADYADSLLPLLLAHASPEARAAALRGLVIARLEGLGMPSIQIAEQVAAGKALAELERHAELSLGEAYAFSQRFVDLFAPDKKVAQVANNVSAPTPPTGGTAE